MATNFPTSTNRISIPISSIDASGRIRDDYSHVEDLAASISERGLLQPVVVTLDHRLVAGGSRLRACQSLGHTNIDVTYIESIPEDELRILEVEENIRRKDFTWLERVVAVARIHELKWHDSVINPLTEKWTQRQTGELLNCSVGYVNNCLSLARLITARDPDILKAESVPDALKILLARKELEANRRLAALTLRPQAASSVGPVTAATDLPISLEALEAIDIFASQPNKFVGGQGIGLPAQIFLPPGSRQDNPPQTSGISCPDSAQPAVASEAVGAAAPQIDLGPTLAQICLQGDCLTHMVSLKGKIDHIVTDIPYGIDMNMLQQSNTGMDVATVRSEHEVDENIELMKKFIPCAFYTLPENGFCVLWYDLDHHQILQDLATSVGFKVQRWPLVWVKSYPCLNQAAQFNFTKSTEFAMVLRKGNVTLTQQQPNNFWIGGKDSDPRFAGHPFAKPLPLWKWLLSAVALKGQTIYDPFAGYGSSTLAALEAGYKPIASELNPDHHSYLTSNVRDFYIQCLSPSQKS